MILESSAKKKNNNSDIWKGAIIALISFLISYVGANLLH